MASDIATATTEQGAAPAAQAARVPAAPAVPAAPVRVGRRTRLSPLTRRILAVNVVAIAILGLGMSYLGQYQQSLVTTEEEALKTQGQIFAAALGDGAVLDVAGEGVSLIPGLGREMMQRLVEPTHTRARLFDDQGELIGDTRLLAAAGGAVQVTELPPPGSDTVMERVARWLRDLADGAPPWGENYRSYRERAKESAADYPEVQSALVGDVGAAVRNDQAGGGLMITAAVPVTRYKQVLGVVLLSKGSEEIESAVRAVRFEILRVFVIALGVTVLLSIYLAGSIVQPIRRLAAAAERVRRGQGRQVAIPDLTLRRDEIGDLSGSLRDMTSALWQRMDAIERFAADVAHEIKNPLTSLKSAVETAARVEDPVKQRKLLALIHEDVARLDRLISDISDASRLDAELSRSEVGWVMIDRMLETVVDVHRETDPADAPQLVLTLPEAPGGRPDSLAVLGIDSRLVQVFRNLIANAISFSPPGGLIRIAAQRRDDLIEVTVEDDGPGVPPGKLEAIFERFYSERPAGEKFGTHSGLGLSISKQIVEAHRGTIACENRHDADGKVIGARFTVRLPVA
jgi:two-component system, OmpR family, sensor histidine kinase ChvG